MQTESSRREYFRQYREKNKEKLRVYYAEYEKKNSAKLSEQRRDAARRRYSENPDKYREKNRAKYAGSAESYRERGRQWKADNSEAVRRTRHLQYLRRKQTNRAVAALQGARDRARTAGMQFDLTNEWLEPRAKVCELSGLPFRPEYDGVHDRNPFAPSIDRIDSKKGYTQDNCRVILCCLNMGLGQWGLQEVAPVWRAVLSRL